MSDNAAGWQPDPTGKHDHRYWDGTGWTDNVANGGVASTDPYEAPADGVAEAEAPAAEEPTAVTPVAAAEDTTASYPTTGTPPPAPPPYVPPTPAAGDDGSGSGGGSKRGLVIGGAILAAVALAVVAFLVLDGDDDEDVRAELATAIENDSDLGSEQAECVADLMVDEAGEEAFADTDFNAEDPPPEFIAAVLDVGMEELIAQCGIDEEAFGSDGTTDTTDGTTDTTESGDGSTDGTIGTDGLSDGDLEEIIADTYVEQLGLSREKAECLAGKITDAIEDGSLTEEEAFSEVFDYLSDCDISMDEISGN